MKRLALAGVLFAGIAHATLGVTTTGALLHDAKTVAILKVTAVGSGWLEGTVTEAFHGPKVGEHVKVGYGAALPGTAAALLVCDGDDNCAADRDRGGFFVIHLPGRKAPIVAQPGVIERRSLGALATAKAAHELCVHAKLHFIDEPAGDTMLEGTFAAADGTGKLAGALLGGKKDATLLVGGPTARRGDALELRMGNTVLVGAPVTRAADGCLVAEVVSDTPLARTPAQFAKNLATGGKPVTIAVGTIEINPARVKSTVWPVKSALRLESGMAPRGPLFADQVLCSVRDPDASGSLALGCQGNKMTGSMLIWLDFGAIGSGESPDVLIARLVADGKPHVIDVGFGTESSPIQRIGTATITHVAD